jgi:hypothetical protein
VVRILFTTTDKFASRAIHHLTGEDCSHVAIQVGSVVIESSFTGVRLRSFSDFAAHNTIVHTVVALVSWKVVLRKYATYQHRGYDVFGLAHLGLRYLTKKYIPGNVVELPKVNLWAVSGMFTCTEFVTQLLDGHEDSMITPHQLYLRITGQ